MIASKALREIRINPIVPTESVLVAKARSMRPRKAEEPAPRDTRTHVDSCPFGRGNEPLTPPTIAAYPADENGQVRIIEDLCPALGDERPGSQLVFGLQQAINGYGRHEVVTDHPQHGIAQQERSVCEHDQSGERGRTAARRVARTDRTVIRPRHWARTVRYHTLYHSQPGYRT
jgi:galactose-1-phosphate uridylyltransferase